MVNVGMDPSNNNFFSYYLNSHGSNSNTSTNPTPNNLLNNSQNQSNFVDDQTQITLSSNQIQTSNPSSLSAQLQQIQQLQIPHSHNDQFIFLDNIKDQQIHQLPTQSTTNIEPTSMLQYSQMNNQVNSQLQIQQSKINSGSSASQLYTHKRNNSGNSTIRANFMDSYINNAPQSSSLENSNSNTIVNNYQNFMLPFLNNQQNSTISNAYHKASPITVIFLIPTLLNITFIYLINLILTL